MKFQTNRLKGERIAQGIGQDEIADKLGIDRSTYSRYENGARSMTVETLTDIATAIGLRPEQMGALFKEGPEDDHAEI